MDANKKWMSNAKNIGCTFAALFAKNPESIGWHTIVNPDGFYIPKSAFILSMQFPDMTKAHVLNWAVSNGFYLEVIDDHNSGLRYKVGGNIAWVQYFGPDSHVKTRQSPIPELMMCVKVPTSYYFKVGFKGILHLAHASIMHISKRKANKMWDINLPLLRLLKPLTMAKILIIGQALPAVPQQFPYDTTMLYTWMAEVGISKEEAQQLFEFEAVCPEFTGHDKYGGHLKPSKDQMLIHWTEVLETKVQLANKIWVLGNVPKEFIEKRHKTWSCSTEWLYTMHPSTRNYHKFSQSKSEVLNSIALFLTGVPYTISSDFKIKHISHSQTALKL